MSINETEDFKSLTFKLKNVDSNPQVRHHGVILWRLNLELSAHLLGDVEGLAVGPLVEPQAAERLSDDGVVGFLQPL